MTDIQRLVGEGAVALLAGLVTIPIGMWVFDCSAGVATACAFVGNFVGEGGKRLLAAANRSQP
jgi:hypothetical protein